MKHIISLVLVLALVTIVMTGCSGATVLREEQLSTENEISQFVIVEENWLWKIVYDTETLCMYAVSYGGHSYGNFTLLVNADGTPRLWKK
jgi:hypothetical protein